MGLWLLGSTIQHRHCCLKTVSVAPWQCCFLCITDTQRCLVRVPQVTGFLFLQVFKNLQLFMENKQPEDDLFDRLNVST